MADSNDNGIDWGAFLQGVGSGIVANNPGTIAVNTAGNMWNLLKAGYGTAGHELGLIKTEDLPEPTDMSNVPLSSEWLRGKLETDPSSGAGTVGNIAGSFLTPAVVAGGVKTGAQLVGGQLAKNAPARAQMWEGVLDGMPRFEINDQYATMKAPIRPGQSPTIIGNVLNHDELYKQYPALRYYRIEPLDPKASNVIDARSGGYSNWGAHGPQEVGDQTLPTIWVNPNLSPSQQQETIIHELQHAIQDKEKFVGGTNMGDTMNAANAIFERLSQGDEGAKKLGAKMLDQGFKPSELSDPKKLGAALYLRQGGETEARAVANRRNMSAYERQQDPFEPDLTSGTPLDWEQTKKTLF